MIRKLLYSFLSAGIMLGLTILLGMIIYVEPAQMSGIVGDNPPAWWSTGLPLSIMDYQDCQAGCIAVVNPLFIAIDLIFWFAFSFIVFKKRIIKI